MNPVRGAHLSVERWLIRLPDGRLLSPEVARDPAAIAIGLSYRHACPEDGMLFVHPTLAVHRFWMKDTLFPLDIVWLDQEGRIVDLFISALPMSVAHLGAPIASAFTLELPCYAAMLSGCGRGMRIDLYP